MSDSLLSQCFFHFERRAAKAHYFLADALLNDLIQPNKCPATNEENLLSVDLDVFLVRMFAAALGRDIARAALQNFQKRLLHSFAGHVTSDTHVIGLASNLIDFVDVNDANLRSFHVVIRILKEPQDDVFDVFADVAGFGQRCRVSNAKRHVQDPGKCLGKQCFAGASRSDE